MQAKFLNIFGRLRAILKGYEDPLRPKFDFEGKYDLWSFARACVNRQYDINRLCITDV